MAAKKLVQVEVLVRRSLNLRRGDVISVDSETADRLVANRQGRLVEQSEED